MGCSRSGTSNKLSARPIWIPMPPAPANILKVRPNTRRNTRRSTERRPHNLKGTIEFAAHCGHSLVQWRRACWSHAGRMHCARREVRGKSHGPLRPPLVSHLEQMPLVVSHVLHCGGPSTNQNLTAAVRLPNFCLRQTVGQEIRIPRKAVWMATG
jgi:hypothetical protein